MKYLSSLFLVLSVSACSVQVIDMASEPTVQKFDLRDIEGDGVIGSRDNCPKSISGTQVDNNGCGSETVEKVRRKLLVNFDSNSFVVKPRFYPEIKGLADFMIEYPSTHVTIEGHTSKRGKKILNQKLSENRAQAIRHLLITKFNIAEDRIDAVGYGFEHLLLEGDDEYIHARNRRIVAEISSEHVIKDMKWTIYSVDEPK